MLLISSRNSSWMVDVVFQAAGSIPRRGLYALGGDGFQQCSGLGRYHGRSAYVNRPAFTAASDSTSAFASAAVSTRR